MIADYIFVDGGKSERFRKYVSCDHMFKKFKKVHGKEILRFPGAPRKKQVKTSAGPGKSQRMAIMSDEPSDTKLGTLSTRSTLSLCFVPERLGPAWLPVTHTGWKGKGVSWPGASQHVSPLHTRAFRALAQGTCHQV